MNTHRLIRPSTTLFCALLLAAPMMSACAPVEAEADAPEAPTADALSGIWDTIHGGGSAPIRSITRRSDGQLIGPISTGHSIEVWISGDGGATWAPHGSVVTNGGVDFGDPTMLHIPGTHTIFCAFREFSGGQWRITVTRSDNDGDGWVYDSTVVGPVSPFVGAPFLFQRQNGDLQIYYDSELLASQNGKGGHQWIAMQGRHGTGGAWDAYGVVAASRALEPNALSRDGMATVVQLGGDRLMIVTEGVEPFQTGGSFANEIHAIESWDGGRTWDGSLRRTIYRPRVDGGSGRRYNAYVPYAIRVGGGPVGVAFCTDEDKGGAPDFSSDPVDRRQCHVKYISTTNTFENWSGSSPIWTGSDRNYTPGLFERASNDVIVTIDQLGGIRVMHSR